MINKIKILDWVKSTSAKGQDYMKVETSIGRMNCFDTEFFEDIIANKGKEVTAHIKESADGKFINLLGIEPLNGQTQILQAAGVTHIIQPAGRYDNNGARVGNAVKLAVELLPIMKDVTPENLYLKIGESAKHLLTIMRTLEKEAL